MVIYNLEEDPNVYITPAHYGNRFVYKMVTFVRDSYNRKVIRNIDLRNDKLTIHGTEIKEPNLRRLYESLTLGVGPKMGHIYVNCNGACYFFVTGKGTCRPIYNVIFDWSSFEVIVPNSLSDSLRKQVEEKQNAIEQSNAQLSVAKDEALSAMASLEATMKNMKELEWKLSSCRKENEDRIKEMRELQEELCCAKNELELMKNKVLEPSEMLDKQKEELQYSSVGMLNKVSDCMDSVNSKVKSADQKLDQALVSHLWSDNRDYSPFFIAIEGVDE